MELLQSFTTPLPQEDVLSADALCIEEGGNISITPITTLLQTDHHDIAGTLLTKTEQGFVEMCLFKEDTVHKQTKYEWKD